MKIKSHNTKGFTLLEILIVVVLLGILTGIVLIHLTDLREESHNTAREADIQTIRSTLELFRAHTGTYPASLDELTSSVPIPGSNPPRNAPRLLQNINDDPTDGNPYTYQRLSPDQFELEGIVIGDGSAQNAP